MKLTVAYLLALACGCSAVEDINLDTRPLARATSPSTCSIGLGRELNSPYWDITVYNVAQPERQDVNIIARAKNQHMGKGDTVTVSGIAITNVDDAAVFDHNIPELKENWLDPKTGRTKVVLKFEVKEGNVTWTTEKCGGVYVAFSAGRESWSCDYPCTNGAGAKEL